MAQKIQIRRDTAANWTTANPVLAQGEPGHEIDTGKVKFGNGIDNWNSLIYQDLTGSSWTQTGSGAVTRTVDEKLKDVVSVKDFGAVGDGVSDDVLAIQAALDSGASTVVFPLSSDDYYISTRINVPEGVTIRYESANFLRADPSCNAGAVVEMSSNTAAYGLKIDADGGDNLNCIGANGQGVSGVTSNIQVIGGHFKNSIRVTAGGRGITWQLGVYNCTATGFIVENCTAAVDVHGHQDTGKYIYNVSFTNFVAKNCKEVASTYGLFDIGPDGATQNQVIISGFAAFNCGDGGVSGGGVFVSHRGAYMQISDGIIVNEAGYGEVGALFRGLGVGHSIANVRFIGNVNTLFLHTHSTTAQGTENPNTPLKRFHASNVWHEGVISGYVVEINNINRCPDEDCLYDNISISGPPTAAIIGPTFFNTNCFLSVFDRSSGKSRSGNFKFYNYGFTTADFVGFEQAGLRGPTSIGGVTSWTTGGVNALGTLSGTDVPVGLYRNGLQYAICDSGFFKINSSAWNGRHLALGSWRLWVDTSGRLRIKSSAPTSDTDGTIVGTQS